jgi:hypothetical protein
MRPGALVAERGWKRSFDDPIPLPRGRSLVTLEDAGKYITKLPRAEHEAGLYRKLKSGRNDGEGRRGLGVNESFRPDESDGKSAHP